MNAANEVAVRAFLNRQIRFTDMPRVVRETMDKLSHLTADSASDIRTAHELATRAASELITL